MQLLSERTLGEWLSTGLKTTPLIKNICSILERNFKIYLSAVQQNVPIIHESDC